MTAGARLEAGRISPQQPEVGGSRLLAFSAGQIGAENSLY